MVLAILVFLLALTSQCSSSACPGGCENWRGTRECDRLNLTAVPEPCGIPVKYFQLDENNFTEIVDNAFANDEYKNILTLDLSKNTIVKVSSHAFNGLDDLMILILAHNKIESISKDTFAPVVHLWELDLSHNPLTTISGTSMGPASLWSLDLRSCKIKNIEDVLRPMDENDVSWMNVHTDINLSQNEISCISEGYLPLIANTNKFSLTDNPLECNCLPGNIQDYCQIVGYINCKNQTEVELCNHSY